LVPDAEKDVIEFLAKTENTKYQIIAEKTKKFLTGFYSPFGLELLSTIDFIRTDKGADSLESITKELENWSGRKKTMFTNPEFIRIAVNNLQTHFT
jgi:hypothetical protein